MIKQCDLYADCCSYADVSDLQKLYKYAEKTLEDIRKKVLDDPGMFFAYDIKCSVLVYTYGSHVFDDAGFDSPQTVPNALRITYQGAMAALLAIDVVGQRPEVLHTWTTNNFVVSADRTCYLQTTREKRDRNHSKIPLSAKAGKYVRFWISHLRFAKNHDRVFSHTVHGSQVYAGFVTTSLRLMAKKAGLHLGGLTCM